VSPSSGATYWPTQNFAVRELPKASGARSQVNNGFTNAAGLHVDPEPNLKPERRGSTEGSVGVRDIAASAASGSERHGRYGDEKTSSNRLSFPAIRSPPGDTTVFQYINPAASRFRG
jgi:hypothetical protein